MKTDDRFLRGALLGLAGGGLLGFLLGSHIRKTRHEAELNEVREHFRQRTEDMERERDITSFLVVPTGRRPADSVDDGVPVRVEFRPEDAYARDDDEPVDPLFGLDDDDYEPGAPRSLGVDGSGNEVEDELAELDSEEDGSQDDSGDKDGHASSPGRDTPDVRGPGPYIISEAEFANECEDYQKLTVIYYRGDDVLVDGQEAIVPDIRGTIGLGTTNRFGEDPDNPNVLYVRNDKIQVDFEVCLDYGSYIEVVLKYGTANPKQPRQFL